MARRTRTKGRTFDGRTTGGKGVSGFYNPYTYEGKKYWHPFYELANKFYEQTPLPFGIVSTNSSYNNEGEEIVDEEPTDSTRFKWNYCKHTKIRYTTGERVLYLKTLRSTPKRYAISSFRVTPPALVAADRPVPGSTTWHQLRAETYGQLIPEFKNPDTFSGLNFLWEMKDLKGALKLASRGVSSIAKHWTDVVQNLTSSKKVCREAASQTLMYDFGIAPLIKDCAGLMNTYENARSALSQFNEKGAVSQLRRSCVANVVSATWTSSSSYDILTWKAHVFRTQAECTYSLKEHVLDDLGGIPEYFGLRATPGKLWDMVPFSFVVDWFTNVGDVLDSLDTKCRASMNVTKYMETLTSECIKVVFCKPYYNSYDLTWIATDLKEPEDALWVKYIKPYYGDRVPLAYSRSTSYERVPMCWNKNVSPFQHVILPELRLPLSGSASSRMRRMRDGLSLLIQARSR